MAGEPYIGVIKLSTLNLSEGEHRITAKARAKGYRDSEPSNEVIAYGISGTWYFNDIPKYATNDIIQSCNFTTEQGYAFNGFKVFTAGSMVVEFGTSYGEKGDGYDITFGWRNNSLRTITFDGVQTVSKEFYEWFTVNAVFAFTIDGTTYYAKEGMTWGEWVESEFNTGGFRDPAMSWVHGNCNAQEGDLHEYVVSENGVGVHVSDIIIANHGYTTVVDERWPDKT